MSVRKLQAAKSETIHAHRRLESTVSALQFRLHPRVLASEAWDGVKEKSSEVADGAVQVARDKPAHVSLGVAALVLFLGRRPIGRAVSRLLSRRKEDDGRVVTQVAVTSDEQNYAVSAPMADAVLTKGAS